VSGVTKLVVTDRARPETPRQLEVVAIGNDGSYAVGDEDSPIQAIVLLGSSTEDVVRQRGRADVVTAEQGRAGSGARVWRRGA